MGRCGVEPGAARGRGVGGSVGRVGEIEKGDEKVIAAVRAGGGAEGVSDRVGPARAVAGGAGGETYSSISVSSGKPCSWWKTSMRTS